MKLNRVKLSLTYTTYEYLNFEVNASTTAELVTVTFDIRNSGQRAGEEVGYGMWGMGGWTGSDDDTSRLALQRAVDLGCNFFDTAWGYGEGHSERLLGELVRANPGKRLFTATKIPPKNWKWPSRRGDPLNQAFPPDHIREFTENSLRNLDLPGVDLIQFHVWEDDWAEEDNRRITLGPMCDPRSDTSRFSCCNTTVWVILR